MPFVIILAVLLLLAALWIFLVAPRKKMQAAMSPFRTSYAHRGLFGGDVPENSLEAFERAAAAGFGIELDVQLSSDGEVFVFHDYTLKRMCGCEGKLSDMTAAALAACRLQGTDATIPTLKEVLATVAGRVPLLIELKGESGNTSLCPAVCEVLTGYEGAWCVESFNPLLLRWFKRNKSDAVRGLLVTHLLKEKKEGSKLLNFALSALWFNFLCRPDFVAWDKKYPRQLGRLLCTSVLGAVSFVFTVKDNKDYECHMREGNYPIFDSFVPDNDGQ